MINTHAHTKKNPQPTKKKKKPWNVHFFLWTSLLTCSGRWPCVVSLRRVTQKECWWQNICLEFLVMRGDHISACLCLACLAVWQLETCVSALVNALRSLQKWIICWTNTGNVNIVFISWSSLLQTLVKQKRDWKLSQSLYREGLAVGSAKGEKVWPVAGWNKCVDES